MAHHYDDDPSLGRTQAAGEPALPPSAVYDPSRDVQGKTLADLINHPSHYNTGKIEVIDFIGDQNLGFNLGNVIKYICRANHKGHRLEDLKKAQWYLSHEIQKESEK